MMRAVDLFAGAGGSTTGAVQAGVRVVAAVNHWRVAVDTHRANHPDVAHVCQDAGLMDPRDLPAHEILLASPACQGHSSARGGREAAHHDASRATAWCVVNTAEVTRPTWIVVENVPMMRNWTLYPTWRDALTRLGYWITENILDASDFGVAQSRKRLFVVGRLDKPAPEIRPRRSVRRAAGDVIDLHAGEWNAIESLCGNTRDRVRAVRDAYGWRDFVLSYQSGSWHDRKPYFGRSLDRPLPTLTGKSTVAVVRGDELRMLSIDERRRGMGFPDGYVVLGKSDECVRILGNAVCPPVMRGVLQAVAA